MSGFRDGKGRFLPDHQFSRTPPEEYERLLELYCEHRSRGMDKQSFVECDYRTLEYNASNLQQEKIRQAEAQGWRTWENILRLVSLGQNVTLPDGTAILAESCNPTLIIFTIKAKMRSLYGDKVEQAVKVDKEEIDYTKLSDGALAEIANARIEPGQGAR